MPDHEFDPDFPEDLLTNRIDALNLLPDLDNTRWDGIDNWLGDWHEEA